MPRIISRLVILSTLVISCASLALAALFAGPADRSRTGAAPKFQEPKVAPTTRSRSTRSVTVDRRDRRAVAVFHRDHYVPYNAVPNAWSGSTRLCRIGRNSKAYDDATLRNLKYYRAMAGVPADVSFAEKYNAPARAAALIMEAKRNLSHGPPRSWPCWSPSGKKGAGKSNLCLGCVGPSAIDAYVRDSGVRGLGHRVWALHPRQKVLGTGSSKRAHALYVFGDWRPRERVAHIKWVAWPGDGYVPYRFGYDSRHPWSFQHHGRKVRHDRARVVMKRDGRRIRVRVESGNRGILVWYPVGLPRATYRNKYNRPEGDIKIEVEVSNIIVDGNKRDFRYTVTFIDPKAVLKQPANNKPVDDVKKKKKIDPSLNLPLLNAAYEGRTAKALDLLKRGADPSARYRGQWSALMYAAYFGHAEIAAALLKEGADASAQYQGWNAAGLAKYRGHAKIHRMLEARSKTRAIVPVVRHRGFGPARPR